MRFKFGRVNKPIDDIFEPSAFEGLRSRLIFAKSYKSGRETVSLLYPLMVNNLITAALNQAAALGFDKISAELIKEA